MKWIVSLFAVSVIGIIIAIPIYLGPDDLRSCGERPEAASSQCHASDAIVAVSGGDTAARALGAVKLYQDGWAPHIIFSGAAMDPTSPSNALVMKRFAIDQGVPADAISIEETSRTTSENADNIRSFIEDQGIDDVILVTSAYHQRRASLEFGAKLGKAVTIRNSPITSDKQWGPGWWLTNGGWWLVGGELTKIIGFYTGASDL